MPRHASRPSSGRTIAIVGAAGGIGRCLVARLLEADCSVVAMDLPASLAQWKAPSGVRSIPIDATDEANVAKAFETLRTEAQALDGFVCLAGFTAARAPLAETSASVFDEVIAGNLKSAFLTVKAAMPLLQAGREAAVVLVSSGLAVKATPGYGPYSAAKAGVLALTRLLAAESAPRVRVNAVAPGAVDTPFLTGGTGRPSRDSNFNREAYLQSVPLARIAEPDDVVGPILFLLGPDSRYMTGKTLHVNGGLLMT
jgi:3-oxoacyl-[acyl-carrier protein] reductase